MYSFSYLKPVCCSMSSSNCCFLTCIQVSQEIDQMVWYSHLFQNFPQFIVSPTVKGFGIVNKAEIDVFLELSDFLSWWLNPPWHVKNLTLNLAHAKYSMHITCPCWNRGIDACIGLIYWRVYGDWPWWQLTCKRGTSGSAEAAKWASWSKPTSDGRLKFFLP